MKYFISRRLEKIRNDIWFGAWEKYKSELTMKELAEMFNATTPTFYRVVARNKRNIKELDSIQV